MSTQAGTDVGPLSSSVSAFGLASLGGQLYTFDSNANLVRQINPRTAATVQSFDIKMGAVLGQGGLAFRADGIGFLSSSLNPSTLAQANNLYTFNIANGTSSVVGMTSEPLIRLAFAPDGTFYGLGKTKVTSPPSTLRMPTSPTSATLPALPAA